MAKNNDSDAIFDKLLCFLSDALFQNPICAFMDEHCLIFDTSIDVGHEHRCVQSKYKKLVDLILSGFCEDSGISLEEALADVENMSKTDDIKAVFEVVFEQMLIADDFEAFQHVMTKRNLLIQEQVLLLIIASTGYHPDSLKPLTEAPSGGDVASRLSAHDNNEQEVLNAIMRQSQTEFAEHERLRAQSNDELERVIALSASEAHALQEQRRRLEQEMRTLSISRSSPDRGSMTAAAAAASAAAAAAAVPVSTSLSAGTLPACRPPPDKLDKLAHEHRSRSDEKVVKPMSGSEAASQWMQAAQSEAGHHGDTSAVVAGVPGDELKARQAYLRQQRDRLLAMKKAARAKQLGDADRTADRPQSSRLARQAVAKTDVITDDSGDGRKAGAREEEKKLAMRRSLADKLRREVIDRH